MMRRLYWIVISFMLLGFLFLFAFERNDQRELIIYTDVSRKSLLLVELDDEIILDLFMNQNQTFYTEMEYLSGSQLADETQQIPILIHQFRYLGTLMFDQIGSLYHYQVVIKLDQTFHDSFHLQMNQPILTLEYYPNLSLSIPIGSLDVIHPRFYEDSNLGLYHLYAIPTTREDCPSMSALVIGLERKKHEPVELHHVTLGFHDEQHRDEPIYVFNPPLDSQPSPTRSDFILPEEPIIMTSQQLYLLIELEGFTNNRFYLSIDYSVNGVHDTLWIDDFTYFSIPIKGGCYEQQLHRTIVPDFRS